MTSPLETPPPHRLSLGVRVRGHEVGPARLGPHAHVASCTCGWRSGPGSPQEATTASASHLAGAWPLLVPREAGESGKVWALRAQIALVRAEQEREALWQRDGMGQSIAPGSPIPVMTRLYMAASGRCDVLEQNLALAHEAMRHENA